MTRAEALEELKKPLYAENELRQDKEYVLKKLGLSVEEFAAIMVASPRSHSEFETDKKRKQAYMKFLQRTQKFRKAFKKTMIG